MAGEIEEPMRRDLQVNCLHSGSISFGRFENEVLCWERRSSFSRNRYIEEVEKCSKTGLVTEKKAYFEAHFKKKKGIQGMCSSENQSHTELGKAESGISENMSYDEEIDGLGKESHSHVDEIMYGSSHQMEPAFVEHEKVEFQISVSQAQIEPTCGDNEEEEHILEHRSVEEADNAKIEGLNSPHPRSGIKIENCEREVAYVDTSYVLDMGTMVPSDNATTKNCHASGKDPKGSSTKDTIPSVARSIKPRLVCRVGVAQSVHVDSQGSIGTEKKKIRTVNNAPTRLKAERRTSEVAASLDNYPTSRTPKIELGSREKGIKLSKRVEKESRNGRLAELPSSMFAKSSSKVHRSTNRLNKSLDITEPCTQHDTTRLSFKFSEHAERRKEFGMKLDGKKHAKDAEMPYHKAKIPEKPEAEIRHLRKSLNFKARPLPSFYTGASRESEKNKVKGTTADPGKLKDKSSSCAGVRVSPNTDDPPQASAATSCHSTVTSECSPRSPAAKTSKAPDPFLARKNGQPSQKKEESKHTSSRSLKVPECKQISKKRSESGIISSAFNRSSRSGQRAIC